MWEVVFDEKIVGELLINYAKKFICQYRVKAF